MSGTPNVAFSNTNVFKLIARKAAKDEALVEVFMMGGDQPFVGIPVGPADPNQSWPECLELVDEYDDKVRTHISWTAIQAMRLGRLTETKLEQNLVESWNQAINPGGILITDVTYVDGTFDLNLEGDGPMIENIQVTGDVVTVDRYSEPDFEPEK